MPRHPAMSLAAGFAALVLVLAGCGDDDGGDGGGGGGAGGDRPTVEEVAEVLPAAGLDDEQVDCLAEAFVDSAISDEGLRAIVDARSVDGAGLQAADTDAVQAAAQEAVTCTANDATEDLPPVTG